MRHSKQLALVAIICTGMASTTALAGGHCKTSKHKEPSKGRGGGYGKPGEGATNDRPNNGGASGGGGSGDERPVARVDMGGGQQTGNGSNSGEFDPNRPQGLARAQSLNQAQRQALHKRFRAELEQSGKSKAERRKHMAQFKKLVSFMAKHPAAVCANQDNGVACKTAEGKTREFRHLAKNTVDQYFGSDKAQAGTANGTQTQTVVIDSYIAQNSNGMAPQVLPQDAFVDTNSSSRAPAVAASGVVTSYQPAAIADAAR